MTARRVPLPGQPDAASIAYVDRHHAATREALDHLVAGVTHTVVRRGFDARDVGVWWTVTSEDVPQAMHEVTAHAPCPLHALAGLLAEAAIRIAVLEAVQ